jgi:protein-tyrosine phosphatase
MSRRSILARVGLVPLVVGMVGSLFAPLAAQSTQDARHIALLGAPNFRDVGGYKTTDGRTVAWGLLYRSGDLSGLTDADYEQLAKFGISAVCDFRLATEQQAAPTRWRGTQQPEFVSLVNPPAAPGRPWQEIVANGGSAADVARSYISGYRAMVIDYAPSFRLTFQRILKSTAPVLYHCSGGKDRTGVFTALLLTLLGVPHTTVVEDYLLSNTYNVTPERVAVRLKTVKGAPDAVRAGMGVDATYLDAAFDEINRKFGSIDNYRRTQLGLSDEDVARLKARLLKP